MNIDFTSIPNLLKSELTVLMSITGNLYKIKQYRTEGGRQSAHPWIASGLWVRDNPTSRLVLEVLTIQSKKICVIRVYRDEPFETMFARKLLNGLDTLPMVISNGLKVFRNALQPPLTKIPEDVNEMVDQIPFSDNERRLMHEVLSPIPPPFNLNEIESD